MNRNLLAASILSSVLVAGAALAAPIAYVAHGGGNVGTAQGGVVGSIDLATGAYTPLTVKLGSLTGLIYKDDFLWTYEVQSGSFKQIDPGTGAVLSTVVRIGGSQLTDMAVDPTDGSVYGVDTSNSYYSIDLATGNMLYLGQMTTAGGFLSLAIDSNGVMYAHATNGPGSFDIVDKSTGATLSTVPGGVPGGALGLAFEPESGQLIASECCGSPDGSLGERLFSLDPVTGAATLLYDYDDGRRIHDIAFDEALPPTSANLRLSFSGPRTPIRSGAATQVYARLDNYGPDASRSPVLALESNAPASAVQVTAPTGWNCISATSGTAAIECSYSGDFARGTVLFPLKVIPPRSMADGIVELAGSATSRSIDPMTSNNSASFSMSVRALPASTTAIATTKGHTTPAAAQDD